MNLKKKISISLLFFSQLIIPENPENSYLTEEAIEELDFEISSMIDEEVERRRAEIHKRGRMELQEIELRKAGEYESVVQENQQNRELEQWEQTKKGSNNKILHVFTFFGIVLCLAFIKSSRSLVLGSYSKKVYQKVLAADEKKAADHRKQIREQNKKERKELEEEINQHISKYEKIYSKRLNKYENQLKEITQIINAEEKQLIDLKNRHSKIETIVSSRKIGDSDLEIISELKKLLAKF